MSVALVGRLAVDQCFHRKGPGGAMLADAALRALKGDAKAFALAADAKDDTAIAFYQHHGFQRFPSKPKLLFSPLGTLKKGTAH